MTMKELFGAGAIATLAISGCSAPSEPSQANRQQTAADHEGAIRVATDRWLGLIRQKDAAAIAALYTEDGALMPPNMPLAQGRAAIEQGWRNMMATPGFDLTFAPEQIVVAAAGDMALDRGTYRFTATGPTGPATETGKYVVVWRNVGGEWKAAADIFNSDGPTPQP
jgi:uncharacterized protein (TIGR02246 family)